MTVDRQLAGALARLDKEELKALVIVAGELVDQVILDDEYGPPSLRLGDLFNMLLEAALAEQLRRANLFAALERDLAHGAGRPPGHRSRDW